MGINSKPYVETLFVKDKIIKEEEYMERNS